METHIYISNTGDGYMNLAVDEYLLEQYHNGCLGGITLYMYVNDDAVIIGRNQNAWRECRVERMERDGVQLVRRHTGGGAVYHDRGNLNFSFITNEFIYDTERQTKVIMNACNSLGIETTVSGRNDILAEGRKFSGNAYAVWGRARGQHGTVLVNTDMTRLSDYLNVSKQKLQAKGVSSVRSRVCNLKELAPVTVDDMKRAITNAFFEEYGGSYDEPVIDAHSPVIERLYTQHTSWEWRLGMAPSFDRSIEHRFTFGELQILMKLKNGVVAEANVFTDALDTTLSEELCGLIVGARYDKSELINRLMDGGTEACEVAKYIEAEVEL